MTGSSPGRLATGQAAILWGGSGEGPADKAFIFQDFPLDALLGRSAAEKQCTAQAASTDGGALLELLNRCFIKPWLLF